MKCRIFNMLPALWWVFNKPKLLFYTGKSCSGYTRGTINLRQHVFRHGVWALGANHKPSPTSRPCAHCAT